MRPPQTGGQQAGLRNECEVGRVAALGAQLDVVFEGCGTLVLDVDAGLGFEVGPCRLEAVGLDIAD